MLLLGPPAAAPSCAEVAQEEPTIAVEIAAERADLSVVADRIAPRIENHLGAAANLAFMISLSREGRATFVLKFKPGVVAEQVLAEVRQRLAIARSELPPEIGVPLVAKIDASAQAVAYLAFSSERAPSMLLGRLPSVLRDAIQGVPGVAAVRFYGVQHTILRVIVDRARLAAYGLALGDVEAALRSRRITAALERGEGDDPQFVVEERTDEVRPELLEKTVLATRAGVPIFLHDVAQIRLDFRSDGFLARFRGEGIVYRFGSERVLLAEVRRHSGMDQRAATLAMRDGLPAIVGRLPANVHHDIGYSCMRCLEPPRR